MVSPAQTVTTERTAEKWLEKRVQTKQTPKHARQPKKQMVENADTLTAQAANGSLSINANNAKNNVD